MQIVENEIIKAKGSAVDRLNKTVNLMMLTIEDVRKQLVIVQNYIRNPEISLFDRLVSVLFLWELANLYEKKLKLINASQMDYEEFSVALPAGTSHLETAQVFSRFIFRN